jgi:hypothetical protein
MGNLHQPFLYVTMQFCKNYQEVQKLKTIQEKEIVSGYYWTIMRVFWTHIVFNNLFYLELYRQRIGNKDEELQ